MDSYPRWHAAEADARDDDADEAFGTVFQSLVEEHAVPLDFPVRPFDMVGEYFFGWPVMLSSP